MKSYKLYNRYNDRIILEDIGDNKYKLITPSTIRISKEDDKINFIDPSGGPFITKDTNLGVYDPEDNHFIKTLKVESIINEGKYFVLQMK